MSAEITVTTLAKMIDISAVRTDVTTEELDSLAEECIKYNLICAFTMPCFTPYLLSKLHSSPHAAVGGVVGFPSGADTTSIKVATARELVQMGCRELDMVINVGALKSQDYAFVTRDIRAVVDAAGGLPVKSILEIGYLTDDEIKRAALLAAEAGVAYVKTGTGWGPKPTTASAIRLIKSTVGDSVRIKAAGGVRNLDTLLEMIEAGCSRFGIGLISCRNIMKEACSRFP